MLNERETAMILAGLRALQATYGCRDSNVTRHLLKRDFPEHFLNLKPLDGDEIEVLCHKVNEPDRRPPHVKKEPILRLYTALHSVLEEAGLFVNEHMEEVLESLCSECEEPLKVAAAQEQAKKEESAGSPPSA